MSLSEILSEIPKLSFAERQEIVRTAIQFDEMLTPEESALLDERMVGFLEDPAAGVPLGDLENRIKGRLRSK